MTGGVNNNVNLSQINQLKQLGQSNEIKKSDLGGNQELNSIFDQVNDTSNDDNGVAVLKDSKEINPFRQALNNLINALTGAGDTKATQQTEEAETPEKTGTPQDVQEFTHADNTNSTDDVKFTDNNGNIESDVKVNDDGSKEIKTGNTTVTSTDNSVTAQEDGKDVGGASKLPNGMMVLDNGEGNQAVFDPKKGEFLSDAESKKILEEFNA